ncbi:MAG TPA: ABC transporter substrate-binding protein [Actinomycetota bacterium]|nr:ABC transporter substrate-binding protein [Actinomycetota bacterium]
MRRCVLLAGLAAVVALPSGCGRGPAAAPPSPTPTLRTIEEGILSVAVDVPSPPFAVAGPSGITGFQADVVREVARRLDLRAELVDIPAWRVYTDVAAGRYDAGVTATPTTPDLEAIVDFSDPYFRQTLALVTAPAERPDVAGLEDLALGDVVAVQGGTTAEAFAERSLRPEGIDVRAYPDPDAAYTAVETGLADALLDAGLTASGQVAGRPDLRIRAVVVSGETLGIGVRPGHPALLDAVNRALDEMLRDGTYGRLYARYPDLPVGGRVTAEG